MDNSKISYPDMDVTCYIDGVEVGGKLISGDRMMSARGVKLLFDGKQMTATEMRKFRFAAPVSDTWSRLPTCLLSSRRRRY